MKRRRHQSWCGLVASLVFLVLLGARSLAQEGATDWPQFRGPGGLGVSQDRGLPLSWSPKENVAWKVELPGPGTSSPIVVGSRIYLTCYHGFGVPGEPGGDISQLRLVLISLRRDNGKTLWTKEITPRLPEQETIRETHGYASSTPAADGERVYAFFGKTGVFAFDHDGRQLWHADVGAKLSGWGSAASPVLFGNLVIVNASVESESLVALDQKTGKEVWRVRNFKDSWNTPLITRSAEGTPELVLAVLGKVLGLNPSTGEQLWTCATDIPWYMVPSLVAHDGVVYCIGGRTGGSLAVRLGGRGEVTGSHRVWIGRKGSNVSSPIYHDGHLYWLHDNLGIAYCCEAKSGKIVYEQRLPGAGQFYAAPVLAEGRIYCVSRTGRTIVLAAKPAYEQLAVNELEAPDYSMLAQPLQAVR